MLHLTPQERTAVAGFLTVCLVGSLIYLGLNRQARPLTWVTTSSVKTKHPPPDINTASAEELEKLPGVGPKTSQNIIQYRAAHGPFLSLYDLRKVKGITKINLQKIIIFYEVPHD